MVCEMEVQADSHPTKKREEKGRRNNGLWAEIPKERSSRSILDLNKATRVVARIPISPSHSNERRMALICTQ